MYYEERPKRTWSVICVVLYLAGMAYLGVGTLPDDLGVWLGLGALFLLPLGVCLAVPFSKLVHHRIDLDARTLRVGRERLPLDSLDPGSVRAALGEAVPGAAQRYATSLNTIDAPLPGFRAADQGNPRLVGGAWGVPMGMDSVVIGTRRGERLTIATRDRAAFLTALSRATAAAPHHL
ncbi:DUF3093 family protein [Streptomyces aureocirculatus]|uniref:DUF3093 family protein n=1 Tax=Streptomyces aureocirculatus TaxID=67275 RepID=UPI0004CDDB35|nr:DUF3093 family protein [Streptomyces aureocirculatus]